MIVREVIVASSRKEQRQPNIPKGSYLLEEAVNLPETKEVPSSFPAQTKEETREMQHTNRIEMVWISRFFDRVNHDILMAKLAKRIGDKRVLKLIRRYLQAGIMINGCCIATEEGTPQGGPLSLLLTNIILDTRGQCVLPVKMI
jgi:hypothetical protein